MNLYKITQSFTLDKINLSKLFFSLQITIGTLYCYQIIIVIWQPDLYLILLSNSNNCNMIPHVVCGHVGIFKAGCVLASDFRFLMASLDPKLTFICFKKELLIESFHSSETQGIAQDSQHFWALHRHPCSGVRDMNK